VAEETRLLQRAEALANLIASNAPLTIRATKESLLRIRGQGRNFDDREILQSCYQSNDFREGMRAFLEKRPAQWTGA
jgi:enoyl-CoA hydratase